MNIYDEYIFTIRHDTIRRYRFPGDQRIKLSVGDRAAPPPQVKTRWAMSDRYFWRALSCPLWRQLTHVTTGGVDRWDKVRLASAAAAACRPHSPVVCDGITDQFPCYCSCTS